MNGGVTGSSELLARARALGATGNYAEVVRLLEPVPRDDLIAEPELGYHLAYAWRRTGASGEALRLTEQLDVPARRSAAEWLIRRRLNLEAMIRFDQGDMRSAEQLWGAVVEHASQADDQMLLAAAHNNLGVVHTLQDRVDAALAAYNRALLASRRIGDRRGVAQALQNMAITFRELSMPIEADAHFRHALREARAVGSDDVSGRVDEERALLMLDLGDTRLAEVTADRALRRLASINDAGGEGEALRVLGIIGLRQRANDRARELLQRALAIAERTRSALLEAETMEAIALLEHAEGNAAAARAHAQEATLRFAAMHADAWGRRIRARTASRAGLSEVAG